MNTPKLKSAINRYLDVGRKTLKAKDIEQAVEGDMALAALKLGEWQTNGWVRIIGSINDLTSDDPCVVLIDYIDNERPWSDPLSGKM